MRTPHSFRSLLVFLLLSCGIAGCGDKQSGDSAAKTVVKGTLVKDGKPFALDESQVKLPAGAHAMPPGIKSENLLNVVFTPAGGGEMVVAKTDPKSGTFEVLGMDGKGIAPGRYRISVTAGLGPGTPDLFGGKYSGDKSPILRDVKANDTITIDVAKPQG